MPLLIGLAFLALYPLFIIFFALYLIYYMFICILFAVFMRFLLSITAVSFSYHHYFSDTHILAEHNIYEASLLPLHRYCGFSSFLCLFYAACVVLKLRIIIRDIFVIVDPDHQDIPFVMFEPVRIVSVFYLCYGSTRVLVVFQFYD